MIGLEYFCQRCQKRFNGFAEKRYRFDTDCTDYNLHGDIFKFCKKCSNEHDIEFYRFMRDFVPDTDLEGLDNNERGIPFAITEEKGNKFYGRVIDEE